MKRVVTTAMSLMVAVGMTACGGSDVQEQEIIGGADEATSIELPVDADNEADESASAELEAATDEAENAGEADSEGAA